MHTSRLLSAHKTVARFCGLLTFLLGTGVVVAQNGADPNSLGWPYEIQTPAARIVIYQPHLESFAGNKLESRAAVSVTLNGQETPVFGAVWFSARVATDFTERLVSLEETTVSAVKFPVGEKADFEALTRVLEEEVSKNDFVFSLDRLLVSLDMVEVERELVGGFSDAAPEIILANRPTVLVTIDGAPR